MRTWLFDRNKGGALQPAEPALPIEKGKQTGEGRDSDDFAKDSRPDLTDRQLDAMEKAQGAAASPTGRGVPRELIATDPAPHSQGSGLSHLAHAAAQAIENYMLGSDSDEDEKLPKINESDRYNAVKERQETFMNDIKRMEHSQGAEPLSPFDRYRTRMGERTGSSGMVEEKLRGEGAETPNRPASPARNRSVEAHTARRLLVSDLPLTLAPVESKPSSELKATRGSLDGVKPTETPRGSFEVASGRRARQMMRSPPVVRRPSEPPGEPLSERNPSLRTPLHSIEEGRTTQQVTRVQNVRVVQPRYLIPREFVYAFGAATTLGLIIGCVTLAIGIRNANYLRGPHASSLLPDVQRELDQVMNLTSAIAAQLGVDVGVRNGR